MSDQKIVTICGSMRFYYRMLDIASRLTAKGYIVLCPIHHENPNDELCKDLNEQRIDMSDEIFVVNPGGYFGKDTAESIKYALFMGKKVSYLEETLNVKRFDQTVHKYFSRKVKDRRNPILMELNKIINEAPVGELNEVFSLLEKLNNREEN